MDWSIWLPSFWSSTLDTLYMVGVATVFTVVLGLPLGVLLVATDSRGPDACTGAESGGRRDCQRRAFVALHYSVGRGDSIHAPGGRHFDRRYCGDCATHAGGDPVLRACGRDQPARG